MKTSLVDASAKKIETLEARITFLERREKAIIFATSAFKTMAGIAHLMQNGERHWTTDDVTNFLGKLEEPQLEIVKCQTNEAMDNLR